MNFVSKASISIEWVTTTTKEGEGEREKANCFLSSLADCRLTNYFTKQ